MKLKAIFLMLAGLGACGFAHAETNQKTYCYTEFFKEGSFLGPQRVSLVFPDHQGSDYGIYESSGENCYKFARVIAGQLEHFYGASARERNSTPLYVTPVEETVFYYVKWGFYSVTQSGDEAYLDYVFSDGLVTSASPETPLHGDRRKTSSGKNVADVLKLQFIANKSLFNCHLVQQIESKVYGKSAGELERYYISETAAECRDQALKDVKSIKAFPTYGPDNRSPGTTEFIEWVYADPERNENKSGSVNEFTPSTSRVSEGDERLNKDGRPVAGMTNF